MTTKKILYTDGRDVTVTDSSLRVKSKTYILEGVTRYGLFTLTPDRLPAIMLLGVGFLLVIAGWLNLITANVISDFKIGETVVGANTAAVWAGAGLMLIGLLVVVVMRRKYAVRITTAEGEKDAVVSYRREYIAQIVDALNEAFKFIGGRGRSSGYATTGE